MLVDSEVYNTTFIKIYAHTRVAIDIDNCVNKLFDHLISMLLFIQVNSAF